jgi:SAM-dependent methyltransferase/archaellum component FlaC
MHLSSLDGMREFRQKYLSGKEGSPLKILDLGSMAIGGSYRPIFEESRWEYTGVDVSSGDNVDIVLSDPYSWLEIESCSMDVVISGQAFEHIEYFWRTMTEIARVLKQGGLCCIIAPSGGREHRYPVDCWRFYPDGFRALAHYADLEVLSVNTHWESRDYEDDSDQWADTILVARKGDKEEPDEADSEHFYRRGIDVESEDSLSKIARYIRSNKSILELGPATGYFTKHLKEKLSCSVHCIEISETMAREAEKYCEKMVVADIDAINLEEAFAGNTYDYIIIADVLEHLREDEKTLVSCRNLLNQGGKCIVSVPNIGHASIIGGLLKGHFDYTNEGLLDRTHLHFYTRRSITRLLEKCGFDIIETDTVTKLPEDTEIRDSLTDLPHDIKKQILDTHDALTYQFIFICGDRSGTQDGERKEVDQKAPSVTDLRRLHLEGLTHRIKELSKGLSDAEEIAFERLSAVKRFEKELSRAQSITYDRLETIKELEAQHRRLEGRYRQTEEEYKQLEDEYRNLENGFIQLKDEYKQVEDQYRQVEDQYRQLEGRYRQLEEHNRLLADQIAKLKSHPLYRIYEKTRTILEKLNIFRAKA